MGESLFAGGEALAGRDVSIFPTFPAWQVLIICGIIGWISFARFTLLTERLRSVLQPYVLKHVETSVPFLLRLQGVHNPTLDILLSSLSYTVSVEFYTASLPFIIWSGHSRLGRHMTMLMAIALYLGNCVKDLVSAPRPPAPVRKLLATHAEEENAQEYGLPSSHTINSICTAGFLLHYIGQNEGSSYWIVACLVGIFLVGVVYGRFYLGMHSPLDVLVGAVMGITILATWCSVSSYVESFIIHGENVISFWTTIAVLLLFAYPSPQRRTPSFEFHTAFNGVALGMAIACHRSYDLLHHEAVQTLSFSSGRDMLSLAVRLGMGLPLILAAKGVSKEVAIRVLPSVCKMLGLQIRSSGYVKGLVSQDVSVSETKKTDGDEMETITGRKSNYLPKSAHSLEDEVLDVDTGIRMIQYTGLGWAVVELVPHLFTYLNL